MLKPIKKGLPIITEDALKVIRKGDSSSLVMLYKHTNDPVQKALLELIFETRGISVEEDKVVA